MRQVPMICATGLGCLGSRFAKSGINSTGTLYGGFSNIFGYAQEDFDDANAAKL